MTGLDIIFITKTIKN